MATTNVRLYGPRRKPRKQESSANFESRLTGFIASERLKQGMTQKDLAEKSETPQSTINRVLGEQVSSKIDTVQPILRALGYTLAIVPDTEAHENNPLSEKFVKNIYAEYVEALAMVRSITEVDREEHPKILFNVVAKQCKLHPRKIKYSVRRDKSENYTMHQDIVLADYNRPLCARLDVSKYTEGDNERYFISIRNDILGVTVFGSPKFEHYFSEIKFLLDDEDSLFSYDDYDFLDELDDDAEFISYLQELLESGCVEDNEKEIVQQIIDKGYCSLRPHQRIDFIDNVLDHHYVEKCELCGSSIPWCEMYDAVMQGDELCGYCRYQYEKVMAD